LLFQKNSFKYVFQKTLFLCLLKLLANIKKRLSKVRPKDESDAEEHVCPHVRGWCLYICIYMYVCVCVCVCIHTQAHTYICIYMHIHVCIYIYIYIHTHTHPHTHTYINICVHTLCRRTLTPLKYSGLRIRMSVVAKLASNLPARALRVAGRPIRVSKETY